MINGIGVVGWGVGGIEAEAGMLGQPVYFLTPDVVGFELTGKLREGRHRHRPGAHRHRDPAPEKVVGKFVEFCGEGTRTLEPARPRHHRQHGARVRRDDGLLPGRREDDRVLPRHRPHEAEIEAFEAYFKAQGLFGVPLAGDIDYSRVVKLDLGTVAPSLAGPKRPQDRIELGHVKSKFAELFSAGAGRQRLQPAGREARPHPVTRLDGRHAQRRRADRRHHQLHQHQQPGRAAGRRPAGQEGGEAGLKVKKHIKTSLAPGSRIVTEYLEKAGLLPYLEKLGFTSPPTAAPPASATPAT
jgi:aconitate hydratase